MPPLTVRASRALNRALGGRDECLCSRVRRRRWIVLETLIDCVVVARGCDVGHCRRIAEWEAGHADAASL